MPDFWTAMRNVFLVALATGWLAPRPAMAQGVFDMGALTGSLSQGALIQSEEARARTGQIFRPSARPPPTQNVDRAALIYRPSLAVRQRSMAQIVERLRRKDPAAAAEMQRTFARRDVIAEIGGVMKPVGLSPNNVADAIATYLVSAYYGVRGSTDGEPAEFKAVSAQVARALSADPMFKGAGDADKQEIAEGMLVQAVLPNQAVQAAQKQPSAMPAIKAAIGQGAQASFGIDLARLRLGANGLQ